MKKIDKANKILLIGKIMRGSGILGIIAFLGLGCYLISRQSFEDGALIGLGLLVVLSFVFLILGDTLSRTGARKDIEAQIKRRSDEK